MKKEYLIAIIAVCALVLVGFKANEMYEKHQRAAKAQKAKEEFDRYLNESYQRSLEFLKKMDEAPSGKKENK